MGDASQIGHSETETSNSHQEEQAVNHQLDFNYY
jgi:hypothetical protein